MKINELEKKAIELRKDILEMIYKAKSGHPGGSLSIIELLLVLYYLEMNIDPKNPKLENRDRFILSKGHAAPALYAILAEKGYIEKSHLDTLRQYGSILQGHPDMKKVAGVEISTGSLGQGLSVANGMALGAKLDNQNFRTYVLMGDGELQEGQVWEAAMTASHYKLNNLCAFIDYNNLQIDGNVDEIMGVNPLNKKWESFGWNVLTIDGHDMEAIFDSIQESKKVTDKPTMIILKTVKGKGVSFMENQCGYHGAAPTEEEIQKIRLELK